MHHLAQLLDDNRAWAERTITRDPSYFINLSREQTPRFLWIGCADSRVQPDEIVGLSPGDIFVHRNVANVVVHSDLNCLSAIQYAVEALRVEHIIVCGHYGCGGVHAALDNKKLGLIDNWLRHIQDVAREYSEQLAAIPEGKLRADKLCELNVIEQTMNVCESTVVQDAWARGQSLAVHGWIFGMNNGLLCDLSLSVAGPEQMTAAHTRAIALCFPESPRDHRENIAV